MEQINWDGFDVPKLRKQDWRWLLRNLAVRNSAHPRFAEVIEQVKRNLKVPQ